MMYTRVRVVQEVPAPTTDLAPGPPRPSPPAPVHPLERRRPPAGQPERAEPARPVPLRPVPDWSAPEPEPASREARQQPPRRSPREPHEGWNQIARGETPSQRLDRNYAEILQEVRVAQTGVQLLLAFLLTLAFTPRFAILSDFERHVYVISLILGSAATALLIAPAPFHRLVFGRRMKRLLVRMSSRMALAGLALLMLALSAAMLLILDVVLGRRPAEVIAAAILGWFMLWWYVVPVCTRIRCRADRAGAQHARHSRA